MLEQIKKRWWYLLLLCSSTIFVVINWKNINQFKTFNPTNLIFILWLVLLLLPLFSEMEFFGIKFKKEVAKATKEVKDSVKELKMQIMDLKISNATNVYFGNEALPTKREIDETLDEISKNPSKHPEQKYVDLDVTDDTVYLFKARLSFEKALKEVCDKTDYIGRPGPTPMLTFLSRQGVIDNRFQEMAKQLILITNRGVHGEIVSQDYIAFVKKALPELLTELEYMKRKIDTYNDDFDVDD